MDYFSNSQSYNTGVQGMAAPQNGQGSSFRDDYNGIVNGLTSTIQLGYTGVSLVYFYKTIKKFFNDYVKTVLKQGKVLAKEKNPKLLIAFLVKKTIEFFKFKTITNNELPIQQ